MSKTVRAFIAVKLSKEIQQFLADIQNDFKKIRPDIKWVKPENIHLTLKFLGNIDREQTEKIENVLTQISEEFDVFDIELSDIGAFPKKEFPRVIWVGIEKNKDKIVKIVEKIEEQSEKIGIPKDDRPFHPHMTLGRLKSNLNRSALVEKLKSASLYRQPSYIVEKLTLYKSTLTPGGPIYEILTEANLKAS